MWFDAVLGMDAAILDWKVRFSFKNFPNHIKKAESIWTRFVQRTQDKWHPTSKWYISSEQLSQQNAIWYGTGEETDFEEIRRPYRIPGKRQHNTWISYNKCHNINSNETNCSKKGRHTTTIETIHWCDAKKTVRLWRHNCRSNLHECKLLFCHMQATSTIK